MRGIVAFLLTLAMVIPSLANDAGVASKLFEPTGAAVALAASGVTSPGIASAAGSDPAARNPDDLKPGKALLLSAMLPGAGEYYAGKKLRAAAFFALEVAAWTGVIYYYNQGMDKDKEFKEYADAHFYRQVYRDKEYELALNPQFGDSGAYTGTQGEWDEQGWDYKIHFLPDRGFTHELPSDQERNSNRSMDQQYYEMIGKYIHQFGFGWDDVFLGVPGAVTGFIGDVAETPEYDNQSGAARKSALYMDMRYDSNQLLDRSALAMQIVMLNHVASALHSSFTVRAMKMKAKASVGFRPIEFDRKQVAVGGLTFSW